MPFKNDDADDLFKKAARDYPLKTDNADWDRVAEQLNRPFSKQTIAKNLLKPVIAMFVLAIASGAMLLYKQQAEKVTAKTVSKETGKPITSNHNNTASPHQQVLDTETGNITKGVITQTGYNQPAAGNSSAYPNNNRQVLATEPIQLMYRYNADAAMKTLVNKPSPAAYHAMLLYAPLANAAVNEKVADEETLQNKDIEAGNVPVELTENTATENNAASTTASPKRYRQSNSFYRVYGTLYGGPEFSMVKFQQINKPGYKVGVSIGYRINNRFSIELGLQRDRLNIYSDGKYLDTAMLKIKPNLAIENVNISSKLTSVPLALRYNFSSKSRGHFFVTAGINAILITHSEQYEFNTSRDGEQAELSKYYSALTPPKYFSGVNASAGYELQLPKFCSMKIESYYQSPVNNLGVGKLPVTSFGVNVGIVKNLK